MVRAESTKEDSVYDITIDAMKPLFLTRYDDFMTFRCTRILPQLLKLFIAGLITLVGA